MFGPERAHLEPIHRSPTGLICRIVGSQHLDHQALTSIFDTLLQECPDLFDSRPIGRLGVIEFALNRLKVLDKQFSPVFELFLQQTLQQSALHLLFTDNANA